MTAYEYYIKNSIVFRNGSSRFRVRKSAVKRIILWNSKGLSTKQIAEKTGQSKGVILAIKKRLLHLYKPIKNLDLIPVKKTFQPYNSNGMVNCICGKLFPVESNHECEQSINRQ